MSQPFKPGDRVMVAKRNHEGIVATVRMVEGDAVVDYGEQIAISPHGSVRTERWPFADLQLLDPPPALDEGDEITVVYGQEKYAPRPYMNFEVGPLFAKTKVRAGETADEAHARVWQWLQARARKQFIDQHNRFLINLQEL